MPRERLQDIVTNIDRVRAPLKGVTPGAELDDKTRDWRDDHSVGILHAAASGWCHRRCHAVVFAHLEARSGGGGASSDWLANDRDEREELVQAARLELWRIDPSRCDVTNREDVNYLRAILRKRMSTVATASFHGRNARSDVVPLDLVKELKCEEEDSAEE